MKQNGKVSMRKNKIINVLFRTLIIAVVFIAVWSYVMCLDNIKMIITGKVLNEAAVKKTVTGEEPVIVSRKETANKAETETIEWYYFVATAYSANDPTQGTKNITATGKVVYEGIIAVDPKIIPLGTKVEIKDLGKFTAEDTGGKIKGNRIDIYFSSREEAKEFGRQGIWLRMIPDISVVAGDFSNRYQD